MLWLLTLPLRILFRLVVGLLLFAAAIAAVPLAALTALGIALFGGSMGLVGGVLALPLLAVIAVLVFAVAVPLLPLLLLAAIIWIGLRALASPRSAWMSYPR